MAGTPDYSVFVNSTDSFEVTWEPFFRLLHEYWPEAGPVTLNTETKDFAHPDVPVTATRVARPGETAIAVGRVHAARPRAHPDGAVRLPAGRLLPLRSRDDRRRRRGRAIVEAEGLDCLRLMECGDSGPWETTPYPWLWSLSRNAAYRIALQAGFWTKTGMRKYIRAHESPWQMEIWGSRARRADRRPDMVRQPRRVSRDPAAGHPVRPDGHRQGPVEQGRGRGAVRTTRDRGALRGARVVGPGLREAKQPRREGAEGAALRVGQGALAVAPLSASAAIRPSVRPS